MRRLFGLLLLVGVTAVVSSCASRSSSSNSQSPLAAAREQLVADLGRCTQTFGYDPKIITGVAENQLAPPRDRVASVRLRCSPQICARASDADGAI